MNPTDLGRALARFDARSAPYDDIERAFEGRAAGVGTALRQWTSSSAFHSFVQAAKHGAEFTLGELSESLRHETDFYVGDMGDDLTSELVVALLEFSEPEDLSPPPPRGWIGAKIHTMDEVRSRIGVALGLILLQVCLTTVFVLIGMGGDRGDGAMAALSDPFNLIDALFLLFLGVGLYFRSRVAAVSLVGYFILSKILLYAAGAGSNILIALVMLGVYGRALEACFAHHWLMRKADPTYRPSRVPGIIAIVLAVLFAPCITLGVIVEIIGTPVGIVSGDQLDREDRAELERIGVLKPEETLEAVYFSSAIAIDEGGVLLTPETLVEWLWLEEMVMTFRTDRDDIEDPVVSRDTLHFRRNGDEHSITFDTPEDAQQFHERLTPRP